MRLMKKSLSFILAAAMIFAMLPARIALAVGEPDITLGSAMLSGSTYYYPNAIVTGSNLKTILISFSDSVTAGDKILLPGAPAGFTVSASSLSNDYVKRINLDAGVTADAVQDYLRGIGFTIASGTQSVEVSVTTEDIQHDTYYNIDREHYYQYIPDTSSPWTAAYNSAKIMTYMGRTGYLATVTSQSEDEFINSLSGGKTGWLGGTILANTGSTGNPLYYDGFNTGAVVGTGWYWACGPEKGTTFYSANSLYPNANSSNASAVDGTNTSNYYNWARGTVSYEPNNQSASVGSTSQDYETCLTTLEISGNTGKHGTSFSWNDKHYNSAGTGDWEAKGYFVEYGDKTVGDNGSGSTAFASDSGMLRKPSGEISLTTVSWTGATTYTCGVDLPATSEMVTISVNSGYFTVPSLGGVLSFRGGTSGTSYIGSYSAGAHFSSAVFSFADASAAETQLSGIVYSLDGAAPQTITATSSTVSPESGDIYFEGHYYRYVDSGSESIDWPSSVLAAGATADPYFGGRGYIATATTQAENSILLRLVENGAGGSDHWDDAWMGGLWERNTGTAASPVIVRGTNGNEISYADIRDTSDKGELLTDYTRTTGDFDLSDSSTYICNKPDTVRYYWIDGPESGEELSNNTDGFAPWHATSGHQDEPNCGDFIYIGWEGAYWDDLSAYQDDNTAYGFDKLNGYIVEFSGFDGGSSAGVIREDTKTTSAYTATIHTRIDGVAAAAPGTVELKKSGSTVATASSGGTGVYTAVVPDGTYDVFINNADTGANIAISGADDSVTVDYYTVRFSVTDAGTASGSTISAKAGGTAISNGTPVLAGKAVVITAVGAGATAYTYAWSGDGTGGETTAALSIDSLGGAVNAACTVTGFNTYTATVRTRIDGAAADITGDVELKKSGSTVATAADAGTGVYTASVPDGTYDIYIDGTDTGADITISGAADSVTVDYYTVRFSVTDAGIASGSTISATAGGTDIPSGTPVPAGKTVVITAIGAGAASYTYAWSGDGTSGETAAALTIDSLSGAVDAECTVTGSPAPPDTYTATVKTRIDGAAADVTGDVELKQGGATIATAADAGTGVYTATVPDGAYDIFIDGTDTGTDIVISGAASSATVNYYTVRFSVTDAGTAHGSTISATADGTDIPSGTAVLAGKAVVITTAGAGATSYTYAWSGDGTGGETTAALSIASLGSAVDAECTVTGSTPAATYTATVRTRIDGAAADVTGDVELKQGAATAATATHTGTGIYTATVPDGTYHIFIDNADTEADITISGAAKSATVNYYTVRFSVTDAGTASGSTISAKADGKSILDGTPVLAGKTVVITAKGAGAKTYTYAWSGHGTDDETTAALTIHSLGGAVDAACIVTGSTPPPTYTATVRTRIDGKVADVTGGVKLRQGKMRSVTAANAGTGVYRASVTDGTYDVYIGGTDTGTDIRISGAANSATVNYYTVRFSVIDAGTASGSTVSATSGETDIASGTPVLAGKTVVITAKSAGAAAYTYAWSGDGTDGETTATLTIPSLGGAVDVDCTVTGSASGHDDPPVVKTKPVSRVTTSGVTLLGSVTSPGGGEVTERGFVYSTAANPVIGGTGVKKTVVDSGSDQFTVALTGLSANTTYYARAYAVSNLGTAYGEVISFKTKGDSDDIPKTGDDSSNLIWWLLCGASAAGIMVLIVLGKRKRTYKRW